MEFTPPKPPQRERLLPPHVSKDRGIHRRRFDEQGIIAKKVPGSPVTHGKEE
jgi:hypothetical protein